MAYDYSHRLGKASALLAGADGLPLRHAPVRVRQVTQAFLYGCAAFESVALLAGRPGGAEREHAQARMAAQAEVFNFVTMPFYWGRYESEQGKTNKDDVMRAARWWRERGATVKGHPLCWHTVCAPWLMAYGDDEIYDMQLARIRREVGGFAGVIDAWDVVNEAVIMPVFDKYDNAVTRICRARGRVKLVKAAFEAAKQANGGATLLINDFDLSESYVILLEGLLEAGVPISAIGLQTHMHQGCMGEEQLAAVLERYSSFGLPLHFTELNIVSGRLMPPHIVDLNDYKADEWPSTPEGEERQAAEAERVYRQLFACPLAQAVTWWSFCDGGWLNAPAGLMTEDAREKPAFAALRRLIKGEWLTPERQYVTDGEGRLEIAGFKGEYAAEYAGGSAVLYCR